MAHHPMTRWRRPRYSAPPFALAQARHAALYLLRAGDRQGAREQLARCALLLHQAHERGPRLSWPGEIAAMRGA